VYIYIYINIYIYIYIYIYLYLYLYLYIYISIYLYIYISIYLYIRGTQVATSNSLSNMINIDKVKIVSRTSRSLYFEACRAVLEACSADFRSSVVSSLLCASLATPGALRAPFNLPPPYTLVFNAIFFVASFEVEIPS
jgi:hypothetical protein